MGILGLLQFVRACSKEKRLSDYRGQTAAVDTYAWLHKIIKGPSGRQLILGGANKYKFVQDCMKRIAKIQNLGIKLIMVFDGGPLPCKMGEQESRKKRREENLVKGKQMLQLGDEAGYKKLIDSIDITPDLAYRLIVQLKKKGVEYIVAPYEADAQLAYLNRTGIVDFIITQDSDLMPFGAKKMLYKIDFATMSGSQIQTDQIPTNKEVNLTWFTHCMFLTTCILSGCDYLNQIAGIGIKTAQRSIGRVTTFRGFLSEIGNKSLIPSDYEANFMKAFLTFRFQRVYCPLRKACVQLNDLSHLSRGIQEMTQYEKQLSWTSQVVNAEVMEYVQTNNMDFSFLGEKYSNVLAMRIAEAQVNPITMIQYDANVAETFHYVPKNAMTSNSILNNAKMFDSKGYKEKKKKTQDFTKESKSLFKFLKEGASQVIKPFGSSQAERIDFSDFQFHSAKSQERATHLKPQFQFRKDQQSLRQRVCNDFKPIKGQLKFTQQNQEEQSRNEDNSPNVSYLEASDSVQIIEEEQLLLSKKQYQSVTTCKSELQKMAEKLFCEVFSQEYLRKPFSF